jgi:hypothetical protein
VKSNEKLLFLGLKGESTTQISLKIYGVSIKREFTTQKRAKLAADALSCQRNFPRENKL